jgi:hypothetical protein
MYTCNFLYGYDKDGRELHGFIKWTRGLFNQERGGDISFLRRTNHQYPCPRKQNIQVRKSQDKRLLERDSVIRNMNCARPLVSQIPCKAHGPCSSKTLETRNKTSKNRGISRVLVQRTPVSPNACRRAAPESEDSIFQKEAAFLHLFFFFFSSFHRLLPFLPSVALQTNVFRLSRV